MNKKIRILLSIFFYSISTVSVFAQKAENWGIESNIYVGQVIKHSPELLFDLGKVNKGIDINFKYQTFGKQKWNQYQRYPQMGVALVYFNYGNKEQLGQSVAILPNLTINILRKPKGYIQFQFGTGLAYLTKPYHPDSNPKNNAIGSYWNNITSFQFHGGVRIDDHWSAQLGFGLTHYSNGSSALPNFGINIAAGTVGVKYTPQPVKQENYIWHDDFLNIPQKRWGAQVHMDIGFRENNASGGVRYPIYIGSAAGVFHFNAVNRMLAGVEIEYNTSVYHSIFNSAANSDPAHAKNQATRYMFFLADEFMFGNFGVLLQAGIYIKKKEKTVGSIYNRLSVRYYLPPIGKPATQFYVAVHLKSHLSVAEYAAFGIGASL
ncbi:MAG: hypothetical protein ACI94Y_001742 [Maribacter sp.]